MATAFHRAAKSKRDRVEVRNFQNRLDQELDRLQRGLLLGSWRPGPLRSFRIRDPKVRIIHAPAFPDRVVHHALMAHAGPVLDRMLVDDTFACRVGRRTVAAVQRCQHHVRRFPVWTKVDVAGYFPSIDHDILLRMLWRKFRDPGIRHLMETIVRGFAPGTGKGLPIGALTSQHFANFYLSPLDRLLSEDRRVRAIVRYMDDVIWWTDDRSNARAVFDDASQFVEERLALAFKPGTVFGRSRDGVDFCGVRVKPGALLLSRRRRKRYAEHRQAWEEAWLDGRVDGLGLQAGYASALAVTLHCDASRWRGRQLAQQPVARELQEHLG
jgi:RNA-directed DNA polymerase